MSDRHQCHRVVAGGDGKGYAAPIWMTFKQAITLGANVRKGTARTLVMFEDGALMLGRAQGRRWSPFRRRDTRIPEFVVCGCISTSLPAAVRPASAGPRGTS